MSTSSQDTQLLQSGQLRAFIQEGTLNPSLPYNYYGCLEINKPGQDLGAQEPVYCPDPTQRNSWLIVDTITKTKALPKFDFLQHASRLLRDVWMRLRDKNACRFNLQVVASLCARPDDLNKFDAKIVFTKSKMSKFDLGDLNVLNGDKNAVVDITGSVEALDMYFIYPIGFQQVADTTVVAEVLDGIYYDAVSCGNCGTPSDGCQKIYLLTLANGGSPGLSGQVVVSNDGGSTWISVDIPPLGGLSGNRMAAMGSKLIVVSEATVAHYYAEFADLDAGLPNWTRQTTGYVGGKGPRCIYGKNSNQAYIGAAGGYIYYLTSPTGAVTVLTDGSITTQNVNDIHGFGRTVVTAGDNNTIMYSSNDGSSWSLLVGPAVGQSLTAVWAMSETTWFVGANNGKLYYTLNAGKVWKQLVFDTLGAAPTITDIQFFDDVVGYMAVQENGQARVYRTTDSGNTWVYNDNAISGMPTTGIERVNTVCPCGPNQVVAAGRKTSAGDGYVAIAR